MLRSSRNVIVMTLLLLSLASTAVLASDPVHWGYEGEAGPEHWGVLSPEFTVCSSGREQSPVDIPVTAAVNPPELQIDYRVSALELVNNGHSIQVYYEPGSSLEVGGSAYELVQFHLHALSEHTLDGAHAAMELHLVHRDRSNRLAVVGVLIVEGQHNPGYEPVLAHMPEEEGERQIIGGATVDAGKLLPAEQSYYHYNGSLTTPPCTEGVTWFVLATPVELSSAQVAAFESLYDHNYRPIQPLNERTFLLTSSAGPAVLPATGGAAGPVDALLLCTGLLAVAVAKALLRRPGNAA